MSLPGWADKDLSMQLPILRDRGEGQHLEFMAHYPENGHELSREIAAFASTNTGTILIGISDNGSITGVDEATTPSGRDTLCRRIEGVCGGNVKPAITPIVKFAMEGERIVLAIEIPRGRQPIYYSKNTPYIRHLSQARPAEPHEVIERIEEWLQAQPKAASGGDERHQFLSSLASLLIDVLVNGDELDDRRINPWFDTLRIQLANTADELRQMAASEIATKEQVEQPLREIADLIERATTHHLTLGRESWQTLSDYVNSATEKAATLKAEKIDQIPLSEVSQQQICETLRKVDRQLVDLDRRAEFLANEGRMEQLQSEASRHGQLLLRLAYYRLDFISPGFSEKLKSIARQLHLLETERLYLDGGASVRRILESLHSLTVELGQLLSKTEK
jgi:hypothetical protein